MCLVFAQKSGNIVTQIHGGTRTSRGKSSVQGFNRNQLHKGDVIWGI